MMKKIKRGMESWGHYLLALLCAGVILLSAVWTREQQAADKADQAALSDQGQRLAQAMETAEPVSYARPAAGTVIQGYCESPVFFPETGVWKSHPCLDFEAEAGQSVYALAAGTVLSSGEAIRIDHGDGSESLYRGIRETKVRPGQRVRAGDEIGTAGAAIPFEGRGHVCVALFQHGTAVPFGDSWQ